MPEKKLPKFGDKIPIDKFHVSETNMRHGQPFPSDEQDETLIANLRARRGKIAELIMARPEGNGYGVYQGARKFQGLAYIGVKELVVGEHCLIKNLTDEEAADSSWIENVDFLRKQVDPITRAKKLNERLSFSTLTLRQLAARDGVGVSTYSEWLAPLNLTPKLQKSISEGHIFFTNGVQAAKMKLGSEQQDRLAEVAEKEGLEEFKKELVRVSGGKLKRGLPPGVYDIVRAAFDKRYKPDVEAIKKLDKLAEEKHMDRNECAKWILHEYLKSKD